MALADGRQVVARTGITMSLTLDSQVFKRQFVITELHQEFDIILGMPFLKEVNPDIKIWDTGTVTLPNSSHIINGIVRPRRVDVEIIHANAMARIIKKSHSTSTNGTTFFLATLHKIDTENETLHAISTDNILPETNRRSNQVDTNRTVGPIYWPSTTAAK